MDKSNQLLLLSPNDTLQFRGVFKAAVTKYLKLTNPSDKNILFKLKSLSPYTFCIRPHSGSLKPRFFIDVAVCVSPFDFDFKDTNKHELMVQYMIAPHGEFNTEALWKEARPDEIMISKVECQFYFEEPNCYTPEEERTTIHPDLSYLPNAYETPIIRVESKVSKTSKCSGAEQSDTNYNTSSFKGSSSNMDTSREGSPWPTDSEHTKDAPSYAPSLLSDLSSDRNADLKNENYQLQQELDALKELYSCLDSDDHLGKMSKISWNTKLLVILSVVCLLVGIVIGKYIL